MRKVHHPRIIRLSSAELSVAPYSSRVWKRRDMVENTDSGERRQGDGVNAWAGLKPVGAEIALEVVTAATGNITIATGLNAGDTVAGIVLAEGSLVLLAGQSAPEENGIYVAGETPARHEDYNETYLMAGKVFKVASLGHYYRCTSDGLGDIDVDPVPFTRVATGVLNFSDVGPATGMQLKAVPELTDLVEIIDMSDGGTRKYTTLTALQTLINV